MSESKENKALQPKPATDPKTDSNATKSVRYATRGPSLDFMFAPLRRLLNSTQRFLEKILAFMVSRRGNGRPRRFIAGLAVGSCFWIFIAWSFGLFNWSEPSQVVQTDPQSELVTEKAKPSLTPAPIAQPIPIAPNSDVLDPLDREIASQSFEGSAEPDSSDADEEFDYLAGIATLESTFTCLLYTSPSPRDATLSRMPSSA